MRKWIDIINEAEAVDEGFGKSVMKTVAGLGALGGAAACDTSDWPRVPDESKTSIMRGETLVPDSHYRQFLAFVNDPYGFIHPPMPSSEVLDDPRYERAAKINPRARAWLDEIRNGVERAEAHTGDGPLPVR